MRCLNGAGLVRAPSPVFIFLLLLAFVLFVFLCLSSAPLTSFDWNETDPSMIGTSSIDTTCTVWDVETGQAKTQLIAHDKEVYDIAFAPSTDVFASAGADGSVRMFDLRSLEHSTIIYESPELVPLLRLEWVSQGGPAPVRAGTGGG